MVLQIRKTRITFDQVEVWEAREGQMPEYLDRDGRLVKSLRATKNKVEVLEPLRLLSETEALLYRHPHAEDGDNYGDQ